MLPARARACTASGGSAGSVNTWLAFSGSDKLLLIVQEFSVDWMRYRQFHPLVRAVIVVDVKPEHHA